MLFVYRFVTTKRQPFTKWGIVWDNNAILLPFFKETPMSKSPKKTKAKKDEAKKVVAPEATLPLDTPAEPELTQTQIDAINERLAQVSSAVRQALDTGNFAYAKELLEKEVMPHTPNHPLALNDLALCERMLGNGELAYSLATHALNFAGEHNLADIYDNLTSICHKLDRFEESKHFARLAIFVKKEAVKNLPANELPKRKKKGLHSDKTKNIIAFALSGNNPSQCEIAVLNASLASQIYPNWTARFYVDDSVPEHVIDRLTQHQAQIIKVAPSPIVPHILSSFAVMADKEVHAFLMRDVNSILSHKEASAVEAWLESKQTFHLMRDHYEHTELVLPSMWGGYTGAFDNIESDLTTFFTNYVANRASVIEFLRSKIYPTLAQSLITHDDMHLDPDSYAYPRYPLSEVEKTPLFHIGAGDAYVRTTSIRLDEPANQIEWYIVNAQEQIICFYTTPTQMIDGKATVLLNLPYFYCQHLETGRWQIRYQAV